MATASERLATFIFWNSAVMCFFTMSRLMPSCVAMELLARVGLKGRESHTPAQLSGGQQQRVAIARALMNSPPVVFADEPTGNLDTKSSVEIMNLFTELSEEGITIVMVTHEDDIAAYAKRHVVMRDGKVMRDDLNQGGRKSQEEVARLVKEALS